VGNEIGYSWAASDESDESVWPRSATDTEDYVVSIVNEMKSRFNIGKVYLLGFSQGCGFTYMTGIQHHELFDGLICFGGWLDTDWISGEEIAEAASLRVFIGHGTQDRMVEFETGVEARDTLEAAGYDVTFYEFDGAHAVPEEMCLAVNEWLNE
jgi:phospholipase/carboxylesterase